MSAPTLEEIVRACHEFEVQGGTVSRIGWGCVETKCGCPITLVCLGRGVGDPRGTGPNLDDDDHEAFGWTAGQLEAKREFVEGFARAYDEQAGTVQSWVTAVGFAWSKLKRLGLA